MTVHIMCLGNELAADDGIGIRVGRVLAELQLPADVQLDVRRMIGFELLDTLQPAAKLVIVDATRRGAAPGTCEVQTLLEVTAQSTTPYCSHGVGLAELLDAMQRVRPEALPKTVQLVGVEAEVLDQCTTELSPAVRQALPEAVALVLALVDGSPELIEQGRQRATQLMDWAPGPTEIIG